MVFDFDVITNRLLSTEFKVEGTKSAFFRLTEHRNNSLIFEEFLTFF